MNLKTDYNIQRRSANEVYICKRATKRKNPPRFMYDMLLHSQVKGTRRAPANSARPPTPRRPRRRPCPRLYRLTHPHPHPLPSYYAIGMSGRRSSSGALSSCPQCKRKSIRINRSKSRSDVGGWKDYRDCWTKNNTRAETSLTWTPQKLFARYVPAGVHPSSVLDLVYVFATLTTLFTRSLGGRNLAVTRNWMWGALAQAEVNNGQRVYARRNLVR